MDRLHVPILSVASAIGRLPFTILEDLGSNLLPSSRELPAPVFVIGYWRSGTTHLSNVLSRSRAFGFLPPICVGMPQEALGLSRLVKPFIEQFYPRTRLIDNVPLVPGLPQEDELAIANLSALSFYHGIYFPRHADEWIARGLFFDGVSQKEVQRWARVLERYLVKMTVHQQRRPLLIRNPVHSTRVGLLRSIWPQAKFIHIYRNPFVVHTSAVRMFTTLFRELSIQRHEVDVDALVLKTYPRMMTSLLEETADLPSGRICTVRYEDFERAPMQEVARIFADLHLDGLDDARQSFASYLGSINSYEKTAHRFDDGQLDEVERQWRPFIERWNYRRPEAARPA